MAIIRLQGEKEKAEGIYYEVDTASAPIGEGGMGKVFKGKSVNSKTGVSRDVAIKFMFLDLPDQAIERARREAGIQLRNDNLIEMLGFIETEEVRDGKTIMHYHVVSELLHGVSLQDVINGKVTDAAGNEIAYAKKLHNDYTKDPDHFAKDMIKAVLSGLMALHDAGYIHRDIDPSNIMITDDEKIKLIDFGICKQIKNLKTQDNNLTVAGAFMGKPEYAAPELALGDVKHQNQSTDIYAAGILLYQCIMGHVPFEGTRFSVLDQQVKSSINLKNIKNKELRRIIKKACEKRQELRYQTSAEMRVDVESLDVKRAADPKKRRLIIIALLAVVAAIIAIVCYHSYSSKRNTEIVEKAYTDSLTNVLNTELSAADEAAIKGYMHDEGYDTKLIEAKTLYLHADEISAELKERGADTPDYSDKVTKLDAALDSAYAELNEKASFFIDDPDPELAAEGARIQSRAEAILKVKGEK